MSIDRAAENGRQADGQHALALLLLRDTPKFFIADRNNRTTYCSANLIGSPLLARSKHAFAALLEREGAVGTLMFVRLDADVMLRIIPLVGDPMELFAVFIEPVKSRNSIETAIKRYDVSRREADVLELLVGGLTTPQIAERLCISEGTVGDHVKSLFRKTKTNKRSELVARIFHWEGDAPSVRAPVPSRRATVSGTFKV